MQKGRLMSSWNLTEAPPDVIKLQETTSLEVAQVSHSTSVGNTLTVSGM